MALPRGFFTGKDADRKSLPTLPTRENDCRKAETVAGVGSSDSSDTSDIKTKGVEENFENSSPAIHDDAVSPSEDDGEDVLPTRADYENFCPGYWQRCAACTEFDDMAELFCRRFNREHSDAFPFAEVESETGKERLILPDDEPGGPAFKPLRCVDCVQWVQGSTAYWSGRCGRTGRKVGFRSRCELGVPEIERPQRGGCTAIGSKTGHRVNAKPKRDK